MPAEGDVLGTNTGRISRCLTGRDAVVAVRTSLLRLCGQTMEAHRATPRPCGESLNSPRSVFCRVPSCEAHTRRGLPTPQAASAAGPCEGDRTQMWHLCVLAPMCVRREVAG